MKLPLFFAIPVGLIAAALTFCVNACDRNNQDDNSRGEVTDTGDTIDVKDNQTDDAAIDTVKIILSSVIPDLLLNPSLIKYCEITFLDSSSPAAIG